MPISVVVPDELETFVSKTAAQLETRSDAVLSEIELAEMRRQYDEMLAALPV